MIYFILLFFTSLAADVHIETLKGKEIASKIEPVTQYIDQLYREPPFLYAGNDQEYKAYLLEFSNDPEAYLNLVLDNQKIVGVALGIPLSHSRDLYKHPFKDVKGIYYIGEFGLNMPYRGKGLEESLLRKLESEAKNKGYHTLAIWELDKSPSDKSPLLPFSFWEKEGYLQHPELSFDISWTNIGEEKESEHKAIYWLKTQ